MLIVFGGLPGTGKTTLACRIARERRATYLRIDTIEQTLRSSGIVTGDMGPTGYMVAYALAETNLRQGQIVVADCVNPLAVTREAWRAVAKRASLPIVEIEVVCSDPGEHRRRVETRTIDVPGLVRPSWTDVLQREYEPWNAPHLRLDTAGHSVADSLSELRLRLGAAAEAAFPAVMS